MADSPNTTSPSRRAVLAGISAAAAPLVAAAEKSTCLACADPVFAAIAQHRTNLARCIETGRSFDSFAKTDIEWPGLVIGGYPGGCNRAPGPIHPAIRGVFDPDAEPPLTVVNLWEIEAIATCLPEEERAAWIDQKFGELGALVEKQVAEDRQSPRGVAWDAFNDACTAMTDSMQRLIATRPTTIAGVAAALDCWLEFAEAGHGLEVVGDEADTLDFLNSLAIAAGSIG
jgi:hypothetical protein